jgi:hypothetical protein
MKTFYYEFKDFPELKEYVDDTLKPINKRVDELIYSYIKI